MLNRIVVMGRLTRDPELRHTQNGIAVASFAVACERDFKDRSTGEKVTDFFDVIAWRQTAEFVSNYFSRGRMAIVEGRLQLRDWTDREGNKRRSAEIVADNVYFGDSKRDNESPDNGGYRANSGSYQQNSQRPPRSSVSAPDYGMPGADQFSDLTEDDGDLPF